MRRIIFSFLTIIMFAVTAAAQTSDESPLRWQVTVKMLTANEGVATFKAILQKGWHLYGLEMPANGPKATTIDVDASRGIEWVTPLEAARKPLTVHDAMFDVDLQWWDADIALRRRFRVTDKANATVAGTISYMGCNDQTCLPPATQKFSKKVIIK